MAKATTNRVKSDPIKCPFGVIVLTSTAHNAFNVGLARSFTPENGKGRFIGWDAEGNVTADFDNSIALGWFLMGPANAGAMQVPPATAPH